MLAIYRIYATLTAQLEQSAVFLAIPGSPRTVSLLTCHTAFRLTAINVSSFQQAVVRNLNEKNAQLQKDLGNVVREGTW